MSAMSVNTFPAVNAIDSPRGWFLTLIILLHVGFFFALNNGLSFSTLLTKPKDLQVSWVPQPETPPKPVHNPVELDPSRWTVVLSTPSPPRPAIDETEMQARPVSEPEASAQPEGRPTPAPPAVIQPAISASGLSEPVYPASEIRAGHEGTVWLSLEILANGRVGEIRLMQSSGYAKLDQSALREARKWRFVPGTRDGTPVTLWKELPIKFELQGRK